MADMTSRPVRLLGFAQAPHADTMRAALAAVPGPRVQTQAGPGWVALLQPEKLGLQLRGGRKAVLTGLHSLQRRLEIACQAGPFLAADPAAALCPPATLRALLGQNCRSIAASLRDWGGWHQWDIIVRWAPEAVLAPRRSRLAQAASHGPAALAEAVAAALRAERDRREAILLAALRPAVLAFAPAGTADTETEIGLTVAVRRGGEAAIEAALERLDQDELPDASVDLRGPLPPLSFAMVRIASTEPGAVAASWRLLGLPETADAAQLHQAWRTAAAAAHPDRAGVNSGTDAMVAVTTAYHQLRGLLPSGGEPRSLRAVLHAAGHRLVLPDAAGLAARELEPSP